MHNNAGVSLLKPITETTETDWDFLFGVNLKGMFFGCKHAIPVMVEIARVALFLASDDAAFVHGAAIVADGGRTIL